MLEASSLKTVTRELTKCVTSSGSEPAYDYIFSFTEMRMLIVTGTGLFVHMGTRRAVKRVELFSDRISYLTLRGRWCGIIVLNVLAPTEDKNNVTNHSFYEEPHGNSVRLFQCKSREERNFETNNWE
jgi:hypothetical protein